MRSLIKSRSGAALNGEEKLSTGGLDNEIDISGKILSELESFLVALMYIEDISVIPHRDDLKSRNTFFHLLKKRLLKKLSPSGGLSEMVRSMFLRQLKIAYKRIHPNHPVYGFIGTILYEIERDPSYFYNPSSPWFGFGAEIDEDFLRNLKGEYGENRFWFSKVTVKQVLRKTHFFKNTLFFSNFTQSLNVLDIEEDSETRRKELVFLDNAGSFSCYQDACSHIQTIGKSSEWLREARLPGRKDIYF